MRHGGAANRPGLEFVCEVKDSTKAVRLIKFEFNSDQTYVLEFGDQYIRFIRDGGQILETAKNITAITQASPGVITSNSHGYSNGDEVYIASVGGMTTLNGRNFKVANVTTNTFTLTYMDGTAVNTTIFSAYTSGGTVARVYTVSSPYLEADLPRLQYVQSADVVTIVHPSYAPRELARVAETNWTLSTLTFAPSISAPTGVSVSGTNGSAATWVITAVKDETFEESLGSTPDADSTSDTVPTSGSPRTITWSAVTGAREYNVYRSINGVYGFIGVAGSTTFTDTGFTPDPTDTPPIARNPFGSSDNYPSCVNYIQQRLTFANTNNDPEKCWMSRTGFFKNFTVRSPLQDDDAITFSLAGRQVNSVRHLLDIGQLIMFSQSGEWSIGGDQAGIIRPTDINPKQSSYNGSNYLAPISIAGNALYVQARGSIVRDLGFDYQVDGYRGNDLTIFSAHLFDGYTLADWDYQQVPHSVIWAVRDDGTTIGCTYVREQQMLAWHRHDTDGSFENVCVISEGDEDSSYFVVNRTIDGRSVRYIERLSSRRVDLVEDSKFVDSSLSYDGRNTGSTTMTLSGGTDWDYLETLTITASSSFFTAADIGNQIHLETADGDIIRFTLNNYTSATVMTGKPNKTVPVSLRTTATTSWSKAVDSVSGLWHLEGESVSILGDGFVVANPNNEAYDVVTVADGAITLDKAYSVIHVGLPYTSDLETLDIDTEQGETLTGKKKRIGKINVFVEESRGLWAGNSRPTDETSSATFLDGLTELKIRSDEGYDDPVALQTGTVDIIIRPEWNSNGRVFIRQTDPIPLSVLAIAPDGNFPIR